MKSLCLTVARFSACAWVGAAALFVVAGVREVTSQQLDSISRDVLVPLRFGPYYAFGFTFVALAALCGWAARNHPVVATWRMRVAVLLLVAALVLMVVDYFFIYRPLVGMITPPGQARPADFITYHHWSERINAIDVGLCLIAGVMMVWPKWKIEV